jgi:hypothetical protein
VVQQIPKFIKEVLAQKPGSTAGTMIGKFHPGLNYDINVWQSNPACGVFPCTEQHQERVRKRDKEGNVRRTIQSTNIEVYLVVTPNQILLLHQSKTNRSVAKLVAWASLHAIEKVKHGLDIPEEVTI